MNKQNKQPESDEQQAQPAAESQPPQDEGAPADTGETSADTGDAETPEQGQGQEPQQQQEQDQDQAMQALRKERDELENRLMRTAADYQNYVKRAEQNLKTAQQQQLMDLAKGLITVLDHFDRAMEVDPEQTSAKDVLSGVQMVRDELMRTLTNFGIERIDVQAGEAFDPNRHEAMMREQREDVDTNHVTQQLQPGYVLDEKVIRPAKVGVAQ